MLGNSLRLFSRRYSNCAAPGQRLRSAQLVLKLLRSTLKNCNAMEFPQQAEEYETGPAKRSAECESVLQRARRLDTAQTSRRGRGKTTSEAAALERQR